MISHFLITSHFFVSVQDLSDRQMGTAMWVIDKLALRVGGEKGEEEADTYGCCSLLKSHLKFNADASIHEIELEFLGKDSMQYKQKIDFTRYGTLGGLVFHCLKSFVSGKKDDQEVFETLSPTLLNKHLTSLMPGLTAKVFRTYNASVTLESQLPTAESMEGLSIQEKIIKVCIFHSQLYFVDIRFLFEKYNAANREVAILCNHQKTVSKAAETAFENLAEKLETMRSQKTDLEK